MRKSLGLYISVTAHQKEKGYCGVWFGKHTGLAMGKKPNVRTKVNVLREHVHKETV